MTTNPTTATSPPAARSLHEICEAARRGRCGYCGQKPRRACTDAGGQDGYHVARFAAAFKAGLISGRELVAVLHAAGVFTVSTVIRDGAS